MPYCGYDGSDLKIGIKPISMDIHGNPKIVCSKCKQEFPVRLVFRTPHGFVENLIQEQHDRDKLFIRHGTLGLGNLDKKRDWLMIDDGYELSKRPVHGSIVFEALKQIKIEGGLEP